MEKFVCEKENCRFNKPHCHTGEMIEVINTEYWCSHDERWVMCPGPCVDGSKHEPYREVSSMAEKLELIFETNEIAGLAETKLVIE